MRALQVTSSAGRRVARLGGAVVAISAALLLITVSSALARRPADPCGDNQSAHVTATGLHCSGVFEIPGHRTWAVPSEVRAKSCDSATQVIAGINHWTGGAAGDWDYWTKNGEWVLWNGTLHAAVGKHDQPINVLGYFHNWGSSPWAVRVFFNCAARY